MATRRRRSVLPAACNASRLKVVIGTLAHNRAFTTSEVREYSARGGGGSIGCDAGAALRTLTRRGFIRRVEGRKLYPTAKGWRWIEGRR